MVSATGAPPPTVMVEQGDHKTLTIRLTPLGAIVGRILGLQSQIRNPLTKDQIVAVNADGSFLAKNVPPVAYEVGIDRTPGLYLKSVRMGDEQLPDRRIDASAKLAPVTVILGANVGEVDGFVQNANGKPTARARVNVIAYGEHSNRMDLNRVGFTDSKGEFKIKDVPPGDYKVFAWQDVPQAAPQDPEFRKPFEKQAAPVHVGPSGRENISVIAIPAMAAIGRDQ